MGDKVEFEVEVNPNSGKQQAVKVCKVDDDEEDVSAVKAEPETKGTVSRKRKLESSGDVASPTKKRKTNDGVVASKEKALSRSDVPVIKLESQDQARSIMEKLKTLTDRHEIHCHVDFKE